MKVPIRILGDVTSKDFEEKRRRLEQLAEKFVINCHSAEDQKRKENAVLHVD